MRRFTKKMRDEFQKRDIRNILEAPFKVNVIVSAKGCCEECQQIDGKMFSMEQFLKEKPLPQKCCSRHNFCTCRYFSRGIRDDNGRLVPK